MNKENKKEEEIINNKTMEENIMDTENTEIMNIEDMNFSKAELDTIDEIADAIVDCGNYVYGTSDMIDGEEAFEVGGHSLKIINYENFGVWCPELAGHFDNLVDAYDYEFIYHLDIADPCDYDKVRLEVALAMQYLKDHVDSAIADKRFEIQNWEKENSEVEDTPMLDGADEIADAIVAGNFEKDKVIGRMVGDDGACLDVLVKDGKEEDDLVVCALIDGKVVKTADVDGFRLGMYFSGITEIEKALAKLCEADITPMIDKVVEDYVLDVFNFDEDAEDVIDDYAIKEMLGKLSGKNLPEDIEDILERKAIKRWEKEEDEPCEKSILKDICDNIEGIDFNVDEDKYRYLDVNSLGCDLCSLFDYLYWDYNTKFIDRWELGLYDTERKSYIEKECGIINLHKCIDGNWRWDDPEKIDALVHAADKIVKKENKIDENGWGDNYESGYEEKVGDIVLAGETYELRFDYDYYENSFVVCDKSGRVIARSNDTKRMDNKIAIHYDYTEYNLFEEIIKVKNKALDRVLAFNTMKKMLDEKMVNRYDGDALEEIKKKCDPYGNRIEEDILFFEWINYYDYKLREAFEEEVGVNA